MDLNLFDQLLMLQPKSEAGFSPQKPVYPPPDVVTKIIMSSNGDVETARGKLIEKQLDFFEFENPEGRKKAEMNVRDICTGKSMVAHMPQSGLCTLPYCIVPK